MTNMHYISVPGIPNYYSGSHLRCAELIIYQGYVEASQINLPHAVYEFIEHTASSVVQSWKLTPRKPARSRR